MASYPEFPCGSCGTLRRVRPNLIAAGQSLYCRTCANKSRVTDEAERFASYAKGVGVVPSHRPELGPCELWTGTVDKDGYGAFALTGGTAQARAHRYAWTQTNGGIPEGLDVCHECDVRLCVRPSHLFLGTTTENTADRDMKHRQARGERVAVAKLTTERVLQIRARAAEGESQSALAREFGTSQQAIHAVVHRQTWKHV
jgi:hypothetical protein